MQVGVDIHAIPCIDEVPLLELSIKNQKHSKTPIAHDQIPTSNIDHELPKDQQEQDDKNPYFTLTLVDHNALCPQQVELGESVVGVIDHHRSVHTPTSLAIAQIS